MGSFAVNRKEMNKGCGVKPGVWVFEEFMYTDSIFGCATVGYKCEARKLTPDEVAKEDTGKPYEIEISEPWVAMLEVHDDAGDPIELSDLAHGECEKIVLEAFADIRENVLDFEAGIL